VDKLAIPVDNFEGIYKTRVYKQPFLGYTCHMSGYIEYKNNPHMRAYLDHLRSENKRRMSICKYCGNKAIGIRVEGYLIYPACEQHLDNTRP
jgi:hypothetical protein